MRVKFKYFKNHRKKWAYPAYFRFEKCDFCAALKWFSSNGKSCKGMHFVYSV